MHNMARGTLRLVTATLATLTLLLFSSLAVLAASQNDEGNPEVTRLLADAREKAAVLSQDADEMEALTRSDVSWQTHATMLNTIKEHVNDLARTVEKLNASRGS